MLLMWDELVNDYMWAFDYGTYRDAVYKDPNDIPEYVYKTLGYEKTEHIENPKLW